NMRFTVPSTKVYSFATGNVGVGKSAPITKLEVAGTISGSLLTMNAPTGDNYMMTNLGVGTATPKFKIESGISSATTTAPAGTEEVGLSIYNSNTTANNWAGIVFPQTSGTDWEANGAGIFAQHVNRTGGTRQTALAFFTQTSGANASEKMRLDQTGNLGIGKTAATKLDVVGTISGSALTLNGPANNSYILGNLSIGKTGAGLSKLDVVGTISGSTLQINGAGTFLTDITVSGGDITGAGGAALDLGEATSGDITVTGDLIVADDSFLGLSSSAGRIVFDDQATDEVTILSANLGIGTSAPKSALDVVGTISGSALTINNSVNANNYFAAGNLGIGTKTPAYLLDISAPDDNQAMFRAVRTGGSRGITINSRGVINAVTAEVSDPAYNFSLEAAISTVTSGSRPFFIIDHDLAPTSGTADFSALVLQGTINQTGGANGATRSLYINPTLTAIADYRAIDIAANSTSAYGIYQSGTSSKNYFAGYVGLNTTTPKARLHVVGSGAFTSFLSGAYLTVQGGNTSILGNTSIGKTGAGLAKLDVVGTISGSALTINNGTSALGALVTLNAPTSSEIRFVEDSSSKWGLFNRLDGAGTFSLYDYAASVSRIIVNTTNGNVSIGAKAAPVAKLEVAGTISGSAVTISGTGDSYFLNANVGIGTGSALIGKLTLSTTDAFNNPALYIRSQETTGSQDIIRIVTDVSSTGNKVFRVNASGATFSDQPYSSAGADYAEWFEALGTIERGEAVCMDVTTNGKVKRCDKEADPNIIGIRSKKPSVVGNALVGASIDKLGIPLPGYELVGLIGQLDANAIASGTGGAIQPGDSLTSASKPGYLRKAKAGEATVGVAMTSLASGEGTIRVLIARSNKSLTTEAVEQKVRENVAALKIDDEIRSSMTKSLALLTASGAFARPVVEQVQREIASLNLDSRISQFESRLTSLSGALARPKAAPAITTMDTLVLEHDLKVAGLVTLGGNVALGGNLKAGGTVTAHALTAQSIVSEGTLTVANEARIGGDLYLEGTLKVQDLFVPGTLKIDGALQASILRGGSAEIGGTLKADVLQGGLLKAERIEAGRIESGSGSVFHGAAIIAGDLTLGGRLILNGTGSAIEAKELIIRNALFVHGPVTIEGLASFLGDVTVKGTLTLSSRQAGTAVIPAGRTFVAVSFGSGFTAPPVVTASPGDFVTTPWRVRPVTQTGFTIELREPASEDLQFSWIAIPVLGAVMASDGEEHDQKPVIHFPVDAAGVPLSGNDVWNACIRNLQTLDAHGKARSCARYHTSNQWEHPDLGMIFTWQDDLTPPLLLLPEGYVQVVTQEPQAASSSSSSSSQAAEQTVTEDTASASSASSEAFTEETPEPEAPPVDEKPGNEPAEASNASGTGTSISAGASSSAASVDLAAPGTTSSSSSHSSAPPSDATGGDAPAQ
ncbi:MAG: Cell wall surface anchor family protein, partial [Candidatus Peregrinibacteria bacterium Greene0416_19]